MLKLTVLILINLFAIIGAAEADQSLCLTGEKAIYSCTNTRAGWGLENLRVDVCQHTTSGKHVLAITRGPEYFLRVSAELAHEERNTIIFTSNFYTETNGLKITGKTGVYEYSEVNNALTANVRCTASP